jgi:hypothetical protein
MLPPTPPVADPAVRLIAPPSVETELPTETDMDPLEDERELPVDKLNEPLVE